MLERGEGRVKWLTFDQFPVKKKQKQKKLSEHKVEIARSVLLSNCIFNFKQNKSLLHRSRVALL